MTRRFYVPLVLTLAFLAVITAVLIAGGLGVRSVVATSFSSAANLRSVRIFVSRILNEQLDEETGVRGYAAAHQHVLLQPYYQGRVMLPSSLARVGRALKTLNMPEALAVLRDASRTNHRWVAEIAYPEIAYRHVPVRIQLHGKRLIDRFRGDIVRIEGALARRAAQAEDRAREAVLSVTLFAVAAVAAVVLAAVLFTVLQYRLAARLESERARTEKERRRSAEIRSAYEAEKRIADTLQGAFTQNLLPHLPSVEFSAAYLPAADEARVGGDWYDVLALNRDRVLVTIGDVAGHGIEAAVAMNRTRQLLVSCALMDPSPGPVLERANSELFRNLSPMVTAVAGLVDPRTCEFVYSAAGHPPPVLLEPGSKARLLDFGSLPMGVARDAAYRSHRVQSVPGAMVVLYTDGAIEHSRDIVEGEALLLAAVESAANNHNGTAEAICAAIFAHRRIADDVAVLTIRFERDVASRSLL